jgi:hypothetical protein
VDVKAQCTQGPNIQFARWKTALLYVSTGLVIAIVQSLLEKGASLGTALAFMMSVIGLSLPETIILKKVLRLPLIFIFVGIVALGIMIVGFLFNLVF